MNKTKSISCFQVSGPDIPVEEGFLSSYVLMDADGRHLEERSYSDNGELETKTFAKYNEQGHLVEEINYMSEDEISEKLSYERNSDNKIGKITIEYADGSKSFKKFSYGQNSLEISTTDDEGESEGKEIRGFDSNGNLIEKVIFDDFNNLEEKEIITYYEGNLVKSKTIYDKNDQIEMIVNYNYDEKLNLVSYIKTNAKNQIIDKVLFSYDEYNQLVEQQIGSHYIVRFKYDNETNTQTEERYDMTGALKFVVTTRFDSDKRVLVEETPLYTKKYIYDLYQ